MEPTAHAIFGDLPAEQQCLVDIIGRQANAGGKWPSFDFIDRTFRQQTGGDTLATMNALPAVRPATGLGAYYLLFSEDGQSWGNPTVRIGLTIAGMLHQIRFRLDYAPGLVKAIDYIARRDRALPPNPDGEVHVELTLDELITAVGTSLDSLAGWPPEQLAPVLRQEPPLWGAVHPDGVIRVTSARWLPAFVDVSEPRDYLARVVRVLGADQKPRPEPVLPSALALPEALGYLEAVWAVRTGSHILGLVRPAAAVKLAASSNSEEEFDGRMSALADILNQLTVKLSPQQEEKAGDEKSLLRLHRYLEEALEPEAFARAAEAVADLRAAVRVRATGQHADAVTEVISRFERLGVKYPPPDWGAAWELIRARCTAAVNTIREELEVLGNGP
jgi:hypothetical protein